jgi:hypothetical protein
LGTVNVVADVAALLGTAAAGSVIAGVSNVVAGRQADRRAERGRAHDLLVLVVTAAATLETERAFFRDRRYSWRTSIISAGLALLQVAAAARDENWVRGAATGIAGMRDRDAAEEARFIERLQAAGAQITPALVQLSLLSPAIAQAASQVGDAIAEGSHARRPAEVRTASQALTSAVASLRDAVLAFTTPPRRSWRRRRPAAPPRRAASH